ncbi:TauD/TfdA dioxygenase family protein [Candidatus Poriferisodalis sp.]|uniref:TauD/TfdA dioxygenase family protein n=1 Tax=Candidatus Poriferisodalis sp. TaxID=3101277 RepID=UPI003AF48AA4
MRVDAVKPNDYNRIRVEPLTGSIGAEIADVDLRELDCELIAELQDAWLAHKVLFFRDQHLTQVQHVAYGRALGELEIHPFAPPEAPDRADAPCHWAQEPVRQPPFHSHERRDDPR